MQSLRDRGSYRRVAAAGVTRSSRSEIRLTSVLGLMEVATLRGALGEPRYLINLGALKEDLVRVRTTDRSQRSGLP